MPLKKQKKLSGLDDAINDVLSELKGFTSDSEEYAAMVDQLVKLHAMKECEKPQNVSMDTLMIVAGNLLGIAMILSYERTNVITTKAVHFLLRKGGIFA